HLLADAVARAMRDARVTRDQVALVIVKSPVMRLEPAVRQGRSAAGPRITSGHAKAVGGLGVGLALGEVPRRAVTRDRIGADHSLYCRRGMVFSGSEVDYCEVVVLGNRPGAGGDLVIHSAQIADVLDAASIRRLLVQAGCRLDAVGGVRDADRVVASFMKVGLAPDGRLRGRRTAILNSHLDVDKHLRATATGVVGSILGTTATFISAGALHQAPPGGGLYACVVRDGSGSRR
ncbi:MAG: ring-opening amidohydrolase, partial [Candidatus Rokuibacteriota bacterium]